MSAAKLSEVLGTGLERVKELREVPRALRRGRERIATKVTKLLDELERVLEDDLRLVRYQEEQYRPGVPTPVTVRRRNGKIEEQCGSFALHHGDRIIPKENP